jgi:hypothetical protein
MNLLRTTQTNIVNLIKYVDDGRAHLGFINEKRKSSHRPQRNWVEEDNFQKYQHNEAYHEYKTSGYRNEIAANTGITAADASHAVNTVLKERIAREFNTHHGGGMAALMGMKKKAKADEPNTPSRQESAIPGESKLIGKKFSSPSFPHLAAQTEGSRVSMDRNTQNTSGVIPSSVGDSKLSGKKKKRKAILNDSDMSSPDWSENSDENGEDPDNFDGPLLTERCAHPEKLVIKLSGGRDGTGKPEKFKSTYQKYLNKTEIRNILHSQHRKRWQKIVDSDLYSINVPTQESHGGTQGLSAARKTMQNRSDQKHGMRWNSIQASTQGSPQAKRWATGRNA